MTRPGCTPPDYGLGDPIDSATTIRLDPAQPACEYHEAPLTQEDCFRCGACCHRGFDVVDVKPAERFAKLHPELIEVRSAQRCVVPRPGGRCVALAGDGSAEAPYLCRHYDDRPRSCRDFELNGEACLIARQRAGYRHQ